MPDIDFKFTGIPHHPAYHAARVTLLGPTYHATGTEADQVRKAPHILEKWRTRLAELRDDGWSSVQQKGHLQYLRNCRPCMFTFESPVEAKVCRYTDICPWCWGRNVVELYDTICRERSCDERLILAKRVRKVLLDQPLRQALRSEQHDLRALIKANRCCYKGAYLNLTAEPTKDNDGWRLESRLLALTELKETYVPESSEWSCEAYVRPNTKAITSAVVRTCYYPAGLMRAESEPNLIVELLHARKSMRLLEYYGCFRKRKKLISPKREESKDGGQCRTVQDLPIRAADELVGSANSP